MNAAEFRVDDVRDENMILGGWSGEHLDLEIAALEPPARQDRGAKNICVEALTRCVVTLEVSGQKQTEQEAVLVQIALRRPQRAAVARPAASPEIDAAEKQELVGFGTAAEIIRRGRIGCWLGQLPTHGCARQHGGGKHCT